MCVGCIVGIPENLSRGRDSQSRPKKSISEISILIPDYHNDKNAKQSDIR